MSHSATYTIISRVVLHMHTSMLINTTVQPLSFSITSPNINNQTSAIGDCQVSEGALFTAIFLIFFGLPAHFLMMKILYKDCEMTLPRHKIMMSLTLSDALQIFNIAASTIFLKSFNVTQYREDACRSIQAAGIFFVTGTMFVSSLSIVSLSIERYITCIHGLHVYQILTAKRVVFAISIQWIIGTGIGVLSVCLHVTSEAPRVLTESLLLQRTSVLVIFPSAITVTLIQLRLFLFSRSKLAGVKPNDAFGNQAEMADFRKKQLKVSFVASIVAIAYIASMFPVAILHAYEWQHGVIKNHPWRPAIISLAMINTLFDPLIYGLLIEETRRMMWKNMKEAKDFLLWHLFKVS